MEFLPRSKEKETRELTISLAAHGTHGHFGFRPRPVEVSNHHLADW